VILYRLLCGQTPFGGPPVIVLFNLINRDPDRPRVNHPGVPADLEANCSSSVTFISGKKEGKVCLPPSN